MKEHNYVTRMMATGGQLLADNTRKETATRWKEMENTWRISSITSCNLIGIFVTAMQLTTTTTSGMHCHKFKINIWMIGGNVGYLLSFWPSQRLINFWLYATLSTVGYIVRECLRYWSFIRSCCGNLLSIYTLRNGRGGISSFQTPFIGWWLHQVTREDIIIGGVFAPKNIPINSTSTALNVEKDKELLRMHPRSGDMQWF